MITLEEIDAELHRISDLEDEARKVADAKREEYIALFKERWRLMDQREAIREGKS